MHYAVHSRPRVGRMRPIWRVIAEITPMHRPRVGRNVGRMRPIWRVIAEITPMRRPQCVGRYAADYAPTFSVHCTVVDTHMIFAC